MDGPGAEPEDLDFQLSWPSDESTEEPEDATTAAPEARPQLPARPVSKSRQVLEVSGSDRQDRGDRLRRALAGINDQVSSLTDQMSELRALVADGLGSRPQPGAAAPEAGAAGTADVRHALEQATQDLTASAGTAERAARRVEQINAALAAELAAVGQGLSDELRRTSAETTATVLRSAEQLGADVEGVGETVSDALAEVSERLDELGRTVAAGRRPDRVVTDSLARLETLMEAVAEAGEEPAPGPDAAAAARLEQVGQAVARRVESSTAAALAAMNEGVQRAAAQLAEAAPPVVDRSTTAAVTRLEERVADLTRQRDEQDRLTTATLNGMEETMSRLASAQAEDLERVLDSIEGAGFGSRRGAEPDRDDTLRRIEASVAYLGRRLTEQAAPAPAETGADLVALRAEVSAVAGQIEALRRRLPVRARGATSLDDESLQALAGLVADHLRGDSEPPGSARTWPPSTTSRRRPIE